MTETAPRCRIAVDVGGTFTDVALALAGGEIVTAKVLTTPDVPEEGVVAAVRQAVAEAGVEPAAVGLVIHGTTLATNALIERTGARTALIVTEGFRDSVEMALENRFEQYDISIDRPAPLVPRHLRWPVTERMNHAGHVLVPLDEQSVHALLPRFERHAIEAVAVGLLHAYANPSHERRVGAILREALPDLRVTLSSEVCPEIREYERQSTACANAYVQPRMSSYLGRLDTALRGLGLECPLLLMTSGGGLTTLEIASRFPIRLVESGPAGGAILAAEIARECDCENALSFDMGGTTAKLALIDGFEPQTTRTFEVARAYRNLKGSGLPVRIPAIEMVEIGAGGGSIAGVDAMGRLNVGPASAGADPGPACYDRGGERPTVTDADVVLGRIDPADFAGGSLQLVPERAAESIRGAVGRPLELADPVAALSISEVVDENMANAARVHAVEWGKDVSARTMIAFGGAAPLHAARLAQKLDVDRVIVPTGAGVGSAIGMLRAAVSYEVVRSRYMRLTEFDPRAANALLEEMQAEARAVVLAGAGANAELEETRHVYMRYVGQGHEIVVPLASRSLADADRETLAAAFDTEYARLFSRTLPDQEREVLSWTLTVTARRDSSITSATKDGALPSPTAVSVGSTDLQPAGGQGPAAAGRRLFDAIRADYVTATTYRRNDLVRDGVVAGPAVIVEEQTTTVVPDGFQVVVNSLGYLILERRDPQVERQPGGN
ncbi:MAG: hydantoinase/oxoprolinase family protein [Rhodospirillales bacterium]|nr:hydantoinase/oxoprolinase family protein [Rhodospirillales bacterium]